VQDHDAYLGRSLNQRAYDAAKAADTAFNTVMRQAAAAGRLASGNTLAAFHKDSERVFNEEFGRAAQFAFNLTENNGEDVIKPLTYFAGRVVNLIMEKVTLCGKRTGIQEDTVARELHNIRETLISQRDRSLDDFVHGMIGDVRLKKETSISVVNNQTNSPGAIQQAGVGNFSQAAFTQQHHALIAAIDKAMVSEEFAALKQEEKDELADVAEALKTEAAKATPILGG
jgi:hypothetical protein